MSKHGKLKIIPLGGLGEVGKNMTAYEYDHQILIVDAGIMFPENDMIGIDYIIPDYEYLRSRADQVLGLVITHGHEDHIGAIHHVLNEIPVPVYATRLTRGLIEGKLARHDFKFDHTPVDGWPTDYGKLAEFANRGVDLLLSDSTNSERPGWTPSEMIIGPAFDKVFAEAQGLVIVATFASLISRIQLVALAAAKHGRKMALAGPSMIDNVKIARQLGYLDIPDDLLVPLDQAMTMQDHKVTLMCTGSQGEPTSVVGRLSTGTNRLFNLRAGDTIVLSSHPIPGNEESISRTINRLLRRGALVIYDGVAQVHVSGHASQEEQKLLINLVRPKHFMPIHGELRQLIRHGGLAKELGMPEENVIIVENGQVVELSGNKVKLGERIPGGYIFVDGESIGDIDHGVMREREMLARNGILLIDVSLDKATGRLRQPPEIMTRGFVSPGDAETVIPEVRRRVTEVVNGGGLEGEKDIVNAVKAYLHQQTKRRPMIFVTLNNG